MPVYLTDADMVLILLESQEIATAYVPEVTESVCNSGVAADQAIKLGILTHIVQCSARMQQEQSRKSSVTPRISMLT